MKNGIKDEKIQKLHTLEQRIHIFISSVKLNKISHNIIYYCFLFAKLIDMLQTGGENNNS